MLCPRCKNELSEDCVDCIYCGLELGNDDQSEWIIIGRVKEKPFADLADETLKSLEIPAVVVSKAGFFGGVGLTLTPFFNANQSSTYEVHVPAHFRETAIDALEAVLGDRLKREV